MYRELEKVGQGRGFKQSRVYESVQKMSDYVRKVSEKCPESVRKVSDFCTAEYGN